MARKKKHAEHVNHERWLVSYADFITLLFAFFVVMFAVSQVDSKKLGHFTESFSKAVGVDVFQDPGKGLMPGSTEGVPSDEDAPTKTAPMPAELNSLQTAVNAASAKDNALANVQVLARRNELVIRLSDGLLFDSGNDALRESAVRVVHHIALELKNRQIAIRVEGHTDDRPIHTARFRSNWELSTGRATTVVAMLAAEGLPAINLSAAGYGEFHPIAPNMAEDGRKQNRRVDLVVSMLPPSERASSKAAARPAPPEGNQAEHEAKADMEAKPAPEPKAAAQEAKEAKVEREAKPAAHEPPKAETKPAAHEVTASDDDKEEP